MAENWFDIIKQPEFASLKPEQQRYAADSYIKKFLEPLDPFKKLSAQTKEVVKAKMYASIGQQYNATGGPVAMTERGIMNAVQGVHVGTLNLLSSITPPNFPAIGSEDFAQAAEYWRTFYRGVEEHITPAMGKYAQAPHTFGEWLDPKRAVNTIFENAPLLGAFAVAYKINPALGQALMMASEGGQTAQTIRDYEERTGLKVPEWQKRTLPITVGYINAKLETLGLEAIFGKWGKGRLAKALVAGVVEPTEEVLQEITQITAESMVGAAPAEVQVVRDRLISSFYGGAILGGFAGGIHSLSISPMDVQLDELAGMRQEQENSPNPERAKMIRETELRIASDYVKQHPDATMEELTKFGDSFKNVSVQLPKEYKVPEERKLTYPRDSLKAGAPVRYILPDASQASIEADPTVSPKSADRMLTAFNSIAAKAPKFASKVKKIFMLPSQEGAWLDGLARVKYDKSPTELTETEVADIHAYRKAFGTVVEYHDSEGAQPPQMAVVVRERGGKSPHPLGFKTSSFVYDLAHEAMHISDYNKLGPEEYSALFPSEVPYAERKGEKRAIAVGTGIYKKFITGAPTGVEFAYEPQMLISVPREFPTISSKIFSKAIEALPEGFDGRVLEISGTPGGLGDHLVEKLGIKRITNVSDKSFKLLTAIKGNPEAFKEATGRIYMMIKSGISTQSIMESLGEYSSGIVNAASWFANNTYASSSMRLMELASRYVRILKNTDVISVPISEASKLMQVGDYVLAANYPSFTKIAKQSLASETQESIVRAKEVGAYYAVRSPLLLDEIETSGAVSTPTEQTTGTYIVPASAASGGLSRAVRMLSVLSKLFNEVVIVDSINQGAPNPPLALVFAPTRQAVFSREAKPYVVGHELAHIIIENNSDSPEVREALSYFNYNIEDLSSAVGSLLADALDSKKLPTAAKAMDLLLSASKAQYELTGDELVARLANKVLRLEPLSGGPATPVLERLSQLGYTITKMQPFERRTINTILDDLDAQEVIVASTGQPGDILPPVTKKYKGEHIPAAELSPRLRTTEEYKEQLLIDGRNYDRFTKKFIEGTIPYTHKPETMTHEQLEAKLKEYQEDPRRVKKAIDMVLKGEIPVNLALVQRVGELRLRNLAQQKLRSTSTREALRELLDDRATFYEQVQLAASATAGRSLEFMKLTSRVNEFLANVRALDKQLPIKLQRDIMQAMSDGSLWTDPRVVNDLEDRAKPPTLKDFIFGFFYSGVLGPTSIITNTASNTFHLIYQMPRLAVAAGVDSVLSSKFMKSVFPSLQKRERQIFFSSVAAMWNRQASGLPTGQAWKRSLSTALALTKESFISGVVPTSLTVKWSDEMGKSYMCFTHESVPDNPIARVLKTIGAKMHLSSITKVLVCTDVFFRSLAYDAYHSLLLDAEARRLGVAPQDVPFTQEIHQKCVDFSQYTTFNDKLGSFGQLAMSIRNLEPHGLGRLVIPFVRTFANIQKRAVEMIPVVGWAAMKRSVSKGNMDIAQALGRQVEGTLLTFAMLSLMGGDEDDDWITGAAPQTQGKRDAFYRAGKMEYAVKIGNSWHSYRWVEPVNTALGALIDLRQAIRDGIEDEDTLTEHFAHVGNTLMNTFVRSSFASNLYDIMSSEGRMRKYIQRMPSNFVPYGSLFRSVHKIVERAALGYVPLRDSNTFLANMANTIPWTAEASAKLGIPGEALMRAIEGPIRVTALGEDVDLPGGLLRAWLPPIVYSEEISDPFEDELEAHGIYPGLPSRSFTYRGKEKELSDNDLYREYCIYYGKHTKLALEQSMAASSYKRATPETKKKYLSKAVTRVHTQAHKFMLNQLIKSGFFE